MAGKSDNTSTYTLLLDDRTSGPASAAAASLTTLRGKLDADTRALREMQQAMARLKAGGLGASTTFKDLQTASTALKASIAQTTQEYVKLNGSMGGASKATQGGLRDLDRLFVASRKLPGPLGLVAGGLDDVSKLLIGGGGVATAALAAASAVVVLTTAVVGVVAALLRYAVAQSDARRSEALRLEGLASLHEAAGGATFQAYATQAAIDSVSASSSLARAAVGGLAETLYRGGLRGNELRTALQAVADTQAVQGTAAATAATRTVIGLARSGASVRGFADNVQRSIGGIARRQLLSLDVQTAKLHENLGRLFDGLNLEGVLSAWSRVTELFSQNTAAGRALKAIVDDLFQPLIDGLAGGAPVARQFMRGLVIGALLVAIAVLTARNAIRNAFGDRSLFGGIDAGTVALYAGLAVVAALVGAFGALAIVGAAVAVSLGLLAAPFVIVGAAVAAVVYGVAQLYDLLAGIDWGGLGTAIWSGLVDGLLRGRDAVVGAVRTIAADATTALRDALGIHSPSRVFAELGAAVPAGFAAGVAEGTGQATGAVDSMGGAAAAAGAAPPGRSVTVSIGTIEVHVGAGASGDDVIAALRDKVADVFEQLALEVGGEVPT